MLGDNNKIIHQKHTNNYHIQTCISDNFKEKGKVTTIDGLKVVGKKLELIGEVICDKCVSSAKSIKDVIIPIKSHTKVTIQKNMW